MGDKNELDSLLGQWQDVPASDPQLKHRVWTRIAAEDSRKAQSLPDWLTQLLGMISTPLGATAFVAASIVCGIVVAELRLDRSSSVQKEELAQNYIQLIEARTQFLKEEDSE
ncbi:MAG: hypothetical protein P8L44_00660 [Opitutales bacterium]|jgi:hypothetical protein|nr:hypothetical protein [bacterium]MDG2166422.1 hypothetical protein [Opitutales bacterium]